MPTTLAVGDTIATVSLGTTKQDATCTGGGGQINRWTSVVDTIYGQKTTTVAHTYATDIAGVGYQIITSTNYYYENSNDFTWYVNVPVSGESAVIVKLIKTSTTIASGTLGKGLIGYAKDDYGTKIVSVNMGDAAIKAPSCSVDTPTINVPLGDHLTTEFTGVDYATESKDIPITLNCQANAQITATINATADKNTTQNGAIKLDNGGASGIAVQIVNKKGNGIKINKAIAVDTTTAEGEYNFTWQARYLQTDSVVTTGDANASATITLSYE